MSSKGIADEFFETLTAYEWPGNVRELQQTLEQVFANAIHHPTLYGYHLPTNIRIFNTLQSLSHKQHSASEPDIPLKLDCPTDWKTFKAEQERLYLQQVFSYTQGNIKEACKVSGLSRARLYQLINLYNLSPQQEIMA